VTPTQVDHLVVAAATLAQGVAWCEATLGVTPAPGGRHALMGTHNRLINLSAPGFPDVYLEIVAIDPEAPPPGRARWFGLDEAALQARLALAPRLVHWVARTTSLAAQHQGLTAAGLDPGRVLGAARETPQGRLEWQIAVRDDGALPAAGTLPTLIQWQGTHPATHMPASGVSLQSVTLHGLPAAAAEWLQLQGVALGSGAGPRLSARLATPLGERQLDTE